MWIFCNSNDIHIHKHYQPSVNTLLIFFNSTYEVVPLEVDQKQYNNSEYAKEPVTIRSNI